MAFAGAMMSTTAVHGARGSGRITSLTPRNAMKLHHLLAIVAATTFSAGAWGQNLKPGLWEVTNNMKGGSGDMGQAAAQAQQQMAKMPPEQRKMMEEMMAKQGMRMGAGGSSVKMCVTKEMSERNELPAQQGDCKTTQQQRS